MVITLFNLYEGDNEEFKVSKTYFDIKEDSWQDGTVSTVNNKKVDSAKTSTIWIFAKEIPQNKAYIKPKKYLELPQDKKDEYFTFKAGDKLYKGKYEGDIKTLKDFNKLDDLVSILTVEDNRFGSYSMQHFEIGGE